MLRKILYLSFLLGLYNTSAQAAFEETIYTGLQFGQFTYEDDFVEGNPSALIFRVGGYLAEGTAIEARFGTGFSGYGDSETFSGVEVDFDVEPMLGLYGLYHIGWGSNASVYGLAGLTVGEVQLSALGASTDTRGTHLSIGIGLNIAGLNFEFTQYFHDKNFDVTALSFGFVTNF
jgi:outer membrane immunogenic protein